MPLRRDRHRRLAPLAALAFLLPTACTGSGSGRHAATAAKARPRRGGTLRIGVERPRSLDPAQARSPAELLLADQLFDALTAYDPTTLQVRPSLAARWQTTPDQQHWDFILKPGTHFANGRAITSADVKYTLERIATKSLGSPASVQLEVVSGYQAFNTGGVAAGLTGVTTPAPDVVHLDLDQPMSSLPAVLGNPSFGVVPREAVEAKAPAPAFADRPVASGPFVLRSRTSTTLHLVPATRSGAMVDAVDVTLADGDAAAYADFAKGRLDWSPVPPDKVDEAGRRYGRAGFRPYVGELFYGFNLKNTKYADPRFREAIARAIDRDAIVRGIYQDTVRVSSGLVAAGVPGHQDDPCAGHCRHDIAAAKALVTAVFGTGTVPTVEIDFDDDETQQKITKAMQENLRAAGIPAELRPHRYADYLKFAISGQQELFRLGWIGSYPAADAFLTPLFLTGLADNVTGFSSPAVDQLLKSGRAEPDPTKRDGIYADAERQIMAQVPVVPIAQYETHAVTSPRVHNLVTSAFGTFDATTVWLSTAR